MTTTIYLDVDGVLNAVVRNAPDVSVTGWASYEVAPVNGFQIQWAPDLIVALNELAARDDVQFKWLTTWTDDAANTLSPAIGVNGKEWPVLDGDQHAWGGNRGWWKLEAIREDVYTTEPDRFIWIDDDLSLEAEALDWLARRTNGMPVSPFMREGLTREHLKLISAFINAADEEAA